MKKRIWSTLALAVLIGAPLALAGTRDASAGVNVGITIGLPTAFGPAPLSAAAIPGTDVYVVPGIQVNVLFCDGHWYQPQDGRWYRADSYDGPWVRLAARSVPSVLVKLPQRYRSAPREYHRVPAAHYEKNWSKWAREDHRDNHKDGVGKIREKGSQSRNSGKGHDRDERGHGRRS